MVVKGIEPETSCIRAELDDVITAFIGVGTILIKRLLNKGGTLARLDFYCLYYVYKIVYVCGNKDIELNVVFIKCKNSDTCSDRIHIQWGIKAEKRTWKHWWPINLRLISKHFLNCTLVTFFNSYKTRVTTCLKTMLLKHTSLTLLFGTEQWQINLF